MHGRPSGQRVWHFASGPFERSTISRTRSRRPFWASATTSSARRPKQGQIGAFLSLGYAGEASSDAGTPAPHPVK
jgi:hypothetical protein